MTTDTIKRPKVKPPTVAGGFNVFADAVRARFAEMAGEPLFVVAADRDVIWAAYLAAFPAGTDPMFRERTEHDCSCCRAFIRSMGPVVAVQNGAISTIWDIAGLPSPYQGVADKMAAYVRGLGIADIFLTKFPKQGTPISREALEGGKVLSWHHFAVEAPHACVVGDDIDERRGNARTTHQVLMRGIDELDPGAVAVVVDLIEQNALYRGEEHLHAVREFQNLQMRARSAPDPRTRALLAWALISSPAARFRNTAIGTLVQDLSEGVELEKAVKSYEAKVAPENYKRPTALITKRMVDDAMRTIHELELEDALARRHARLGDVSVNSVLFVDNAVRGRMKGGVEGLLMDEVRAPVRDLKTAEPIAVADFMEKVLPKVRSVQLYVDNSKMSNFMSLTAPVHDGVGRLFRWGNDFAWSYEGNAADSIRERVKRAGGQVEGVALRASLAWYNHDDLDLHVREPDGTHIYFGNKHGFQGGKLDVDMNAGRGATREPVENIRWADRLRDGCYKIWVNQFCKRESSGVGFEIEIECDGRLEAYRYEKAVRSQGNVQVAEVTVRGGRVMEIAPGESMVGGAASREQWGIATERLHRVSAIILSPNHWGVQPVGNRHWFFILEGCKNPAPTRGIYNEFLHPRLEKHRKVFEVLGDKTKCPPMGEQLSGLGFSSTRREKVYAVVSGPRMNKAYAIEF
jgi:hypothetical protein